jgi:elongation factor G
MASRTPGNIRNIVFCGHSSCGKTTLVESVLFKAGAIARKGRIEDGTTVTDFDTQERAHKHSIDLTWAHAESKGVTINIVDSPGYRDFLGQVYCAVPVVEGAVLVVDAD